MSKKNKLRRRCVECRQVFDVVSAKEPRRIPKFDYLHGYAFNVVMWQSDPFQEEIRGDPSPRWLCVECAYDSAMEI